MTNRTKLRKALRSATDVERPDEIAARLITLADRIQRLNERECNDPSFDDHDRSLRDLYERKARHLAHGAGLPPIVIGWTWFPRGASPLMLEERPDGWPFVDFVGTAYIPRS